MKTGFLILFVFTLLFLLGCSMEETNVIPSKPDTVKMENATMYLKMSLSDQYKSVMVSAVSNSASNQISNRTSQNMSANGHFSPAEGWVCTFSGMQNAAGIHGSAILTGPPVRFKMSTGCMVFDGNEAVYGGIVTQIFYQDEEDFGFLEPGMYCAFKVKDNGEGQNGMVDQVGYNLWFWWGDSPCDYLPPSSEDWGPMIDVIGQGDQIQVK